jgi:hypothetical protein
MDEHRGYTTNKGCDLNILYDDNLLKKCGGGWKMDEQRGSKRKKKFVISHSTYDDLAKKH